MGTHSKLHTMNVQKPTVLHRSDQTTNKELLSKGERVTVRLLRLQKDSSRYQHTSFEPCSSICMWQKIHKRERGPAKKTAKPNANSRSEEKEFDLNPKPQKPCKPNIEDRNFNYFQVCKNSSDLENHVRKFLRTSLDQPSVAKFALIACVSIILFTYR